jgi:hypothetical protein
MACSDNSVFCDWLDVTYSPESSPISDVHLFLDTLLCPVRYSDNEQTIIDVGNGVLVMQLKKRFHRFSASGAALAHLRKLLEFEPFLSILASCPHKVTRLDAALDIPIDAPKILRFLESKFPKDEVNLQRKSLRVTRMYSARASDGSQTGTWYAGHRSSARVTARVYDKQAESLDKRGEVILPLTRVELTFRKDHGCTLRDAAMPYSLFHSFAAPLLQNPPSDVPEWVPNGDPWVSPPVRPKLPYELFKRRLETSPELDRLIELASGFGESGEALILRAFSDRLHARNRAQTAPVENDGSDVVHVRSA